MTSTRVACPVIAIAFLVFASLAVGQQAPAPRAEARPAQPADAPRANIETIVRSAEEGLNKLEAGAGKLQAKLKTEFQNGVEWRAGVEGVKQAAKDFDTARKAAVARLQTNAEYAQAAAAHQKARQAFDAVADRPENKVSRDQLADKVQAARVALGKLETAALNADPEVQKAKEAVQKAQADLAALKKRAETAYEKHPEWLAYQKKLDEVSKTLADARAVQRQQDYTTQTQAEQVAQDRQRAETLMRLQQELLRQQIVLVIQQQQLANAQMYAPQMTRLGQSGVYGGNYYYDADHCNPRRVNSHNRSISRGTRSMYR